MKLSADKNHPDYHDVVNFVQDVFCSGVRLTNCVHLDIQEKPKLSTFTVVTQPIKVENGRMATHKIEGECELTFNASMDNKLFQHFYNDWSERERLAVAEQHAI